MCQSIQVNSRRNLYHESRGLGICSTTFRRQVRWFNWSARSRLLRASLLATSLAAMVLPAQGQQTWWEGTASTDWFTGSNWDTGSVPTTGVAVTLDTTTPNSTVVNGGSAESYSLQVGSSGTGMLSIQNGGVLNNEFLAVIGNGETATGTARVSGAGSAWTNGNVIHVGSRGTGTLGISYGGLVSNTDGWIGAANGSEGNVSVFGANSSWSNSGILYVGGGGTATLIIEEGGAVSSGEGHLGEVAGSQGTVIVSGAGSTWTNSAFLHVGSAGRGDLTIQGGGAVSNGNNGFVGHSAGSQGMVTVTGANSTWTNHGIFVGYHGFGGLIIEDGGAVSSANGYIADQLGSQGLVQVTGAGSSWTSSGDYIIVGTRGLGGLEILNGGSVNSNRGIVGHSADSEGFVTVSGANSTWTNNGNVEIGRAGTGTLKIEDGGTVTSVNGAVGGLAGAEGFVTVSGAGSSWTSSGDHIIVGVRGSGLLTIENGGAVINTVGSVGSHHQGLVRVRGANSTWTNNGILQIGAYGIGGLIIEDGGAVTSVNGVVGDGADSEGFVTVSGAGSSWTSSGSYITVGNSGFGTLAIENGGAVSNGLASIGFQAGSQGMVTVSGSGSTWTNSDEIHIGRSGTGTLTIADSGTVAVADELFVGFDAGGTGAVTVAGAGSTLTSNSLPVGYSGTGTLTIAEGGAVSSAYGTVGSNAGSTGDAVVTGTGSSWTSGSLLVGYQGTGTLTIADGGAVVVEADHPVNDRILVADDPGSTGTVNIGASAGDQAVAPGVVNTRIQFGEGTGTLNFNHTATDFVFDPGISGPGAVNVLAGTTIFDNNKQYTGPTTVDDGGTLIVNGSIASSSSLTVNPGGQVGGSGTFPSTTYDGGTASPGNSIGVMNIAGDVTFTQDSTYEVEVDPAGTASDLIHATGTATLGGASVVHIGLAGDYRPLSTYTILTADGRIDGTFGDVASDFAFLDATLGYDTNDVTLTLERNDVSFDDIGVTANQIATGTGAESLGAGNPVHDAVVVLDEVIARAALDLLSGEIHASAKTALIEDSHFVRDAANERMRAAFQGVGAPNTPVLAYGPDGAAPASASADTGLAIWTHGFGSWGEIDSDGNAASLSSSTGGLIVGGDAMLGDWRLGLMAGYSHTSFDVDDRVSSGSSDNYHLGLYGGTEWGALAFRSGLAYTWHDIATSRGVIAGDFTDQVEGDYDAGTFQAFGELGYRIDLGQAAFEPFANLAYANLDTDGFAESGGAAALDSSGGSMDTTFTTLGLRVSTGFALGTMNATARGMVGWRHAYGDTTPLSTQAFAGGDAFTVEGVPIAEDAAVIEAGLDLNLTDAATLGVSYNGQFGSGVQQNGFTAKLAVKF